MERNAGGVTASGRMVGRDHESQRIEEALAGIGAGALRVVVISGEAGIGKTRLVNEAIKRGDSQLRTLRAGCLSLASRLPYLPFAELLRDLVDQVPRHDLLSIVGGSRDELSRFVPELADSLGRPEHEPTARSGHGEMGRLRLYESFLRVAERIAADQPTLFLVEDVQWSDQASLQLLSFLAHGIRPGIPAGLIVTVRPEEAASRDSVLTLLAELDRTAAVERIELGPLAMGDVRGMVTAIRGDALPDEDVARLAQLSDGNPLFIEELVAAEGATTGEPSVPPRLRDLIAARLARVPDETLAVLRVAAAAGRTIDDRLLAAVSGLDEVQVQRAVRAAVDDHILVSLEGPERAACRFRHEITRSLVAAQLLPAEAEHIHAAYARALAAMAGPGEHTSEIADHWDAAGDTAQAFGAHLVAGRTAEGVFAFDRAQAHFERALVLWDRVPDPQRVADEPRLKLIDSAASAAARAGRFDRAVELTREIMAHRDAMEPEAFELSRSNLRWYLWEGGDIPTARAESEAVVAEGAMVPDRWRANALAHLGGLLLYERRAGEAEAVALQAREFAEEAGALQERIMADGVIGWCRLLSGDVDAGLAAIATVVEATEQVDGSRMEGRYPVYSALAHAQLALALEMVSRYEEAYQVAIAGTAIAAEQGVARTFGSGMQASAARALCQLGRWDEASEAIDRALAEGAVGSGRIALHAQQASLLIARGQLDEAERIIGTAEATAGDDLPGDVRRWLTAARVELLIWRGEPGAALAVLALAADDGDAPPSVTPSGRPAMPDASMPHLLTLGARAAADLAIAERADAGDSGSAAAAIERLRAAIERVRRQKTLAAAWAAELAVVKAELDRSEAPPNMRIRRWRDAHSRVEARPYLRAYCGWRLAEAELSKRDGRGVAAATIGTALETAGALGATLVVEQLEALARRARLSVVTDDGRVIATETSGRPFGLTEREVEVLALVADGLSNHEIAARLYISPKTASVHVSNIYGKMGVESRVAAATLAHSVGITSPEERLPER